MRYVVTRDGHSVGIRIVEFDGGTNGRPLSLAVRDRGRMECADQLIERSCQPDVMKSPKVVVGYD